jgi:hypothetical protein
MTYKVTFSYGNNRSVKLVQPSKSKVSWGYNIEIMPQRLNELFDVEISGNSNKYVLMYDSVSGKWKNVNPDEVLSAATTEPISPGLPQDFENKLDEDLDNKIDLDAGIF